MNQYEQFIQDCMRTITAFPVVKARTYGELVRKRKALHLREDKFFSELAFIGDIIVRRDYKDIVEGLMSEMQVDARERMKNDAEFAVDAMRYKLPKGAYTERDLQAAVKSLGLTQRDFAESRVLRAVVYSFSQNCIEKICQKCESINIF